MMRVRGLNVLANKKLTRGIPMYRVHMRPELGCQLKLFTAPWTEPRILGILSSYLEITVQDVNLVVVATVIIQVRGAGETFLACLTTVSTHLD